MEDTKLEMLSERNVQSWKEEINKPRLEDKEKIQIIKEDAPLIEDEINKNFFFDFKNISEKDLNYKGKKGNIKKFKRNIISNYKNINLIILLIFFNLIISNNNKIEYKISKIKLKIKNTGFSDILNSNLIRNQVDNYILDLSYNIIIELIWNNPIENCHHMFDGFSNSIIEIDLSNFDISKVTDMSSMLNGCSKLEYINLTNFKDNNSLNVTDIFNSVPDNIVVCLNESSDKILNEIKKKNCYTLDCSDNWKINQKKIVSKTDICFDIFNNDILYKYEYHGLYYENCINGNLINNSTINYCKCNNENCNSCSNLSFLDLEYNLYEIEGDNNLNIYRKCYKDIAGYYLDISDNIYKKCYYSCERCEIKGDGIAHNCIKCNNNYSIEYKMNNYSNCYQNCSNYYYYDEYNNHHCSNDSSCPDEYSILEGMECKKINKITNIEENLKTNCLNNIKTEVEEEIKCYDSIMKYMEDIFISKDYDTSFLDKGKDEIIEIKKIKVILTTSQNQRNNINSNITNIDLGECEQSLRRAYNLTNNETLYIKMLEVSQEEMRITKIEYDIYAKLNGGNLVKLSLNECKNNKISLLIPVYNVDNLDKLNRKSGYYNDFCYTATSDSGTDITIKDRRNEYPLNAVCQDGCDFEDYNYTFKKAICSCHAKESSSSFNDMKIDKKNH